MASYCDRDAIEARIGRDRLALIADLDQDGAEDVGAVDQAIADVDGQIGSALARRWPQYIGVPTGELRRLAVDLTVSALARGPARVDEDDDRADRARADLRAIAAGDRHPDPDSLAGSAATSADGAGEVLFDASRRVMTGGPF